MANKVKQLQVSLFKQLSVMHVKTVVSYEKTRQTINSVVGICDLAKFT